MLSLTGKKFWVKYNTFSTGLRNVLTSQDEELLEKYLRQRKKMVSTSIL